MRNFVLIAAAVTTALSIAAPAEGAATPSFQDLGHLPYSAAYHFTAAEEISADGTTVVGYDYVNDYKKYFRWTADGGMVEISDEGKENINYPLSISADGSAVFGSTSSGAGTYNAFRWTAENGKELLWPDGYVSDVSADGRIAVGDYTLPDRTYQANRWTEAGGLVPLGLLPGDTYSFATGVSADGSVIVGLSAGTDFGELFRWTAANGMVALGRLPGETSVGNSAVSADGSVIAGNSGVQLFRWTEGDGMLDMGTLPGAESLRVRDMSADGSIVVGSCWLENEGPVAFIWDAANGIQTMDDYLADLGLDLPGWLFKKATGISADGTVIVGSGINLNQDIFNKAWMATIPEPTSLAMLALGGLAVLRRRSLQIKRRK